MKRNQKLSVIVASAVLIFSSCKKDVTPTPSTPSTPNLPSAAALDDFFQANLDSYKQTFTIDASSPSLITGANGTTVQFFANSFEDASGQTVTGNITVELTEVLDKASMVLSNKATMAYDFSGGIAPLISGGEMQIEAFSNGQSVSLKAGYNYMITVPAPNGTDPNMSLFYSRNTNDTLIWTGADSASIWSQGNSYVAYLDSLNWINCDYFYSNPNPQTTVEVELPSGFTNQTCALYISFDNMNSIASFYSYANGTYTTSPNYTLPVGLDVHFIAISVINNVPNVAIIPATISNNHHEVILSLTTTTQTQFETDLSNLP